MEDCYNLTFSEDLKDTKFIGQINKNTGKKKIFSGKNLKDLPYFYSRFSGKNKKLHANLKLVQLNLENNPLKL